MLPQFFPTHMANFAVDAVKLADLQLQLWSLDARAFWTGARMALAVLAVGTALLMASLPVAMLGGAEYLRHLLKMPLEQTLLLISGISAIIAIGMVIYAVRRLKTASEHLKNSSDELRENLQWLRQELHGEDSVDSLRGQR